MATKTNKVLLAAVAGLLTVGTIAATSASAAEQAKVKCYGANACKGHSACAGAGHGCAGKNGCKGQGFVEVDSKEACLKMDGGRLTPEK
ncbi:MAG: hypothetical protein SF182_03545 [Deltaproteobacteria bacterium]|nr:hypothetical protein [Deltaproteobacteria bacterium]